jgi:hypothetical protein
LPLAFWQFGRGKAERVRARRRGGGIASQSMRESIGTVLIDSPAAAHGGVVQRCLDMSKIMEMPAGAQAQDPSWLLRSGSWTMDRIVDCSCETPSRLRGSSFFTMPNATGNRQLPTARPRRTTHVVVPAGAVYTGGHPLEKGSRSLTFSHFSARPACLFDGKARSTSRFVAGGSNSRRGLPERAKHHVGRKPQKSHIDFR